MFRHFCILEHQRLSPCTLNELICLFLSFQAINGLYCVGDSCFPGQGVIAVAFSGVMCAHRVAADLGKHTR